MKCDDLLEHLGANHPWPKENHLEAVVLPQKIKVSNTYQIAPRGMKKKAEYKFTEMIWKGLLRWCHISKSFSGRRQRMSFSFSFRDCVFSFPCRTETVSTLSPPPEVRHLHLGFPSAQQSRLVRVDDQTELDIPQRSEGRNVNADASLQQTIGPCPSLKAFVLMPHS